MRKRPLLASFGAAFLVAIAFAYYNYKFSQYRFLNFSSLVFYTNGVIFEPNSTIYRVLLYSSKAKNVEKILKNMPRNWPILAIDYYSKDFPNNKNVTFLKSGTNTNLQLFRRFNIGDLPAVFTIKKQRSNVYKQDSKIKILRR